MKHNISLQGKAFRLRPVADADAPLIVSLRSNPALNRFLHVTSNRVEDQLQWLAAYYKRPGDYYFAVERISSGETEGVISIYDLDEAQSCAEWGRWIIKPGSAAAIESAWLVYRCAFECLNLKSVYCRTLAQNKPVVSFHDSFGARRVRVLPQYAQIGEAAFDAVEHCVDGALWQELSPRVEQLVDFAAQRLAGD